jgi:hypothetical protein
LNDRFDKLLIDKGDIHLRVGSAADAASESGTWPLGRVIVNYPLFFKQRLFRFRPSSGDSVFE